MRLMQTLNEKTSEDPTFGRRRTKKQGILIRGPVQCREVNLPNNRGNRETPMLCTEQNSDSHVLVSLQIKTTVLQNDPVLIQKRKLKP